MPPGHRLGVLYLFLKNVSDVDLQLRNVELIGDVSALSVERIQVAPLGGDIHTTPGGIYSTDPPAALFAGRCHVQSLVPLDGYTLHPGDEVRVWMVVRAQRVGRYAFDAHLVEYESEDGLFQQRQPWGYRGAVRPRAIVPPIPSDEAACLSHSSLLTSN